MIWSIRKGDIIGLPRHVYHYEVKNVKGEWVWLENTLNHTNRSLRISTILNEAKIIRRTD